MVKKPGYPAASRRVSFTFNEDDDVRLGYFRNWRTNGHERWEGDTYIMKEKIFG